MSGWTEADYEAYLGRRAVTKPSKYRNVKLVIDGEKFDSKREAAYWQQLKMREKIGEIDHLQRQVAFPLYCPEVYRGTQLRVQVAEYIADFVFLEYGVQHVVDAKGKRTAMYAMKAKWLLLQEGIDIEEV